MKGFSETGIHPGFGVGDGASRQQDRRGKPDDSDYDESDEDDYETPKGNAAIREYMRQQRSQELERASAQRSRDAKSEVSPNSKGTPQAARRRLSRRDHERSVHSGSVHSGSVHSGSVHSGSAANGGYGSRAADGRATTGGSGKSQAGSTSGRSAASGHGANPAVSKDARAHESAAAGGENQLKVSIKNRSWLYLLSSIGPGDKTEMLKLFDEVEQRHRRLVDDSDGSEVAELLSDEVITCWLERIRCSMQEQFDSISDGPRVTARTRATESATKRLLNALKVYHEYKSKKT